MVPHEQCICATIELPIERNIKIDYINIVPNLRNRLLSKRNLKFYVLPEGAKKDKLLQPDNISSPWPKRFEELEIVRIFQRDSSASELSKSLFLQHKYMKKGCKHDKCNVISRCLSTTVYETAWLSMKNPYTSLCNHDAGNGPQKENFIIQSAYHKRIKVVSSMYESSSAIDVATDNRTATEHQWMLTSIPNKKLSKTMGLPSKLLLRVEARYIVTSNIDTSDVLVNGALGVLRLIDFGVHRQNVDDRRPIHVWIEFDNADVDTNLKSRNRALMVFRNIRNWTPTEWVTKMIRRSGQSTMSDNPTKLSLLNYLQEIEDLWIVLCFMLLTLELLLQSVYSSLQAVLDQQPHLIAKVCWQESAIAAAICSADTAFFFSSIKTVGAKFQFMFHNILLAKTWTILDDDIDDLAIPGFELFSRIVLHGPFGCCIYLRKVKYDCKCDYFCSGNTISISSPDGVYYIAGDFNVPIS
ncbi:hypothetical protein BDA99DRAFT_538178 [Phascolomyces articulosus]|uniref:Uncharacterized protein n=1 Tax=Phascolomyces articulosus TaxID=60185 RepID=A0AAD5JYB4_9FUNG|nr:hypothetical protein BDA99DRAFT_538178 [Phascolomyces articulosus]